MTQAVLTNIRVTPISRPITLVFALIVVFTNLMLGMLLYFQFERQLTIAWSDRYHVPLDNLDKGIEYGLQLGLSLRTMGNLPQLLVKTARRYPELTTLFVVDPHGTLIARGSGRNDRIPTIGPLLAGFGNNEVNGKSVTTPGGRHFLIWSIKNPFGDTAGFVLMKLPWSELQQLHQLGRERLIIGIAAVMALFITASLGLFRLICRDLESNLRSMDECADRLLAGHHCRQGPECSQQKGCAFSDLAVRLGQLSPPAAPSTPGTPSRAILSHSRFRARILGGALLLLLGSCISSTTIGYFIFRDVYIPVLYSQSRIIGESLGELVTDMHGHGIPVDKMAGMKQIFSDLLDGFPQIAGIGLYDAAGKRLATLERSGDQTLPASTAVQGLDDPESVTTPVLYKQSLIGMIRLNVVPHFFATRLLDIALNVITLLVVSILIASELLTFVVRFLVAVPLEGLFRELHGDATYSQSLPTMLGASMLHRISSKSRALLERAPAPARDVRHFGGSPLLAYVRPPLFLVVFADAMSLSFLPMYVESFHQTVSWLSPNLLMALPISAFMLVWAISLPFAGQWSDRIGRRRSFLVGALITAAGQAMTAAATGIFQLILFRSLTAVGYGIVYISAQSYVTDHTTARDRTQGMATFLAGFFSGSLCGAALGGILADRIGYHATFGVSALISLMAALFVYHFIAQGAQANRNPATGTSLRLADFIRLFRDRCFLQVAVLTAIPAKILLTGFVYYAAPLYLHGAGANRSEAGQIIMLYGLTIVLLGPVTAWLADRWNLRRSFIGIGALTSAAALCIPFLHPGIGGFLAAILLVGIAHATAVAPQMAVITEHLQARPDAPSIGKVIGIFRLSERSGNILGPILFGALLTVARPETIFLQIGLFVALAAALFLTMVGGCRMRSDKP